MKSTLYLLLLYTLFVQPAFAQIGMGGQPHPSAVLDLKMLASNVFARVKQANKCIFVLQNSAYV